MLPKFEEKLAKGLNRINSEISTDYIKALQIDKNRYSKAQKTMA